MSLSPIRYPSFVEIYLTFLNKGDLSLGVMTRSKASSLSEKESKGGLREGSGQKSVGRRTNRERREDQASIYKSMGKQATIREILR